MIIILFNILEDFINRLIVKISRPKSCRNNCKIHLSVLLSLTVNLLFVIVIIVIIDNDHSMLQIYCCIK